MDTRLAITLRVRQLAFHLRPNVSVARAFSDYQAVGERQKLPNLYPTIVAACEMFLTCWTTTRILAIRDRHRGHAIVSQSSLVMISTLG